MDTPYVDEGRPEIDRVLREVHDGRLAGVPLRADEAKFIEWTCSIVSAREVLGPWEGNDSLVKRMESALRRHGRAAHELEIVLFEWLLREGVFATDPGRVAAFHTLAGAGYLKKCELRDGTPADLERAAVHYRFAIGHHDAVASAPEITRTIHHELGQVLDLQGHRDAAIAEFGRALAGYADGGPARELAEIRSNLAMTLLKGNEPEDAEEAIRHIELAMHETTKSETPELWCSLLARMGIAHRHRILGDKVQNLETAARYLSAALTGFEALGDGFGRARMHDGLGAVYSERMALGGTDFLQKTIDHCRAAQSFYTENREPYKWANLERKIGIALLSGENRNENERRAGVVHLHSAARVYRRLGRAHLADDISAMALLNDELLQLEPGPKSAHDPGHDSGHDQVK